MTMDTAELQKPKSRSARDKNYRLETQIGFWLRRAYQRHMAIFGDIMADLDLTSMQFAALVKLRDLTELSQAELGRLTGMDRATMSGVVGRLQRRKLITYRSDPKDKRSRIISLTEGGIKLLDEALRRIDRVSEDTLRPIDNGDRQVLLNLLRKLA